MTVSNSNGNGRHPTLDNMGLDFQDLELIPVTPQKQRVSVLIQLRSLLFGNGQFSPARILAIVIVGWLAITAIPRAFQATSKPVEQSKQAVNPTEALRQDRGVKGVMFRVTERYDQTSGETRNDITSALARVYIDHANEQSEPYAYLVRQLNDRLYDLNQIKGSKLVWEGADLEQAAKVQLHIDALALAMNATAQETISNLDRSVDLIPLAKSGDTQMGVFQRQVIPAKTDPPPPKPEPAFKVPPWFQQPLNPPEPLGKVESNAKGESTE